MSRTFQPCGSRLGSGTIVPDDITNSVGVLVVAIAIYYAIKIVRLSDKFDYVALKGGRAPYYVVAGLFFLETERIVDLMANWFAALGFNFQAATTFNDPHAALAGLFIAPGLMHPELKDKGADSQP